MDTSLLSSKSQCDRVHVTLGIRSYSIIIGPGAMEEVVLADHIFGRRLMVVTNEIVDRLYFENIARNFKEFQVDKVVLPDGEKIKTLDGLNVILSALLERGHDRTTTVVALGGGVIGDIAGFAAAVYQRGIDYLQIPTTMLAQVDSAVGGKTGVNHALGKNMIGAFHQPSIVIADTMTLKTLPKREFAAGLSEVIKYGLIADRCFFDWVEKNLDGLLTHDSNLLTYAIRVSCQIKSSIVSQDETEQGHRAILNFGHTFGHAIETFLQYRDWVHGEAIAVGMLMAMKLSVLLGSISETDFDRLKVMLERCGLPTSPPILMTVEDFNLIMMRDKKVIDGQLRLVILHTLGLATVSTEYGDSNLQKVLSLHCTAQ